MKVSTLIVFILFVFSNNIETIKAQDIFEATKKGDIQAIRQLLSGKNFDIDLKDRLGRTPLHWAARNDQLDMVKMLVDNKADVNVKDNRGYTPLYYSVWFGELYEIAEVLVESGADVNFKQNNDLSVLYLACREKKEKIVKLLVEKGVDLNSKNAVGKTSIFISVENKNRNIVELLLSNNADLSIKDNFGRTPLHQATIEGYLEISELLIKNGAKVNETDNAGETPLYYADKYRHNNLSNFLKTKGGKSKGTEKNFDFSTMLKKELDNNEAMIWFLGHAGWAVKTKNTLLIFDYWERGKSNEPSLANGRINPEEIKYLDVYVFVSHIHDDHYDEIIFEWEKTIENITYVFGWQNDKGKKHVSLSPREKKTIGNIKVFSVNSPEANPHDNAFLVKTDGISVYHAGDYGLLGGVTEITPIYENDMNYLKENAAGLDIMFLGGRILNNKLPKYIAYSLEEIKPVVFFPMHAPNNVYDFKKLVDEIVKSGYNSHLIPPENRGDIYIYKNRAFQNY